MPETDNTPQTYRDIVAQSIEGQKPGLHNLLSRMVAGERYSPPQVDIKEETEKEIVQDPLASSFADGLARRRRGGGTTEQSFGGVDLYGSTSKAHTPTRNLLVDRVAKRLNEIRDSNDQLSSELAAPLLESLAYDQGMSVRLDRTPREPIDLVSGMVKYGDGRKFVEASSDPTAAEDALRNFDTETRKAINDEMEQIISETVAHFWDSEKGGVPFEDLDWVLAVVDTLGPPGGDLLYTGKVVRATLHSANPINKAEIAKRYAGVSEDSWLLNTLDNVKQKLEAGERPEVSEETKKAIVEFQGKVLLEQSNSAVQRIKEAQEKLTEYGQDAQLLGILDFVDQLDLDKTRRTTRSRGVKSTDSLRAQTDYAQLMDQASGRSNPIRGAVIDLLSQHSKGKTDKKLSRKKIVDLIPQEERGRAREHLEGKNLPVEDLSRRTVGELADLLAYKVVDGTALGVPLAVYQNRNKLKSMPERNQAADVIFSGISHGDIADAVSKPTTERLFSLAQSAVDNQRYEIAKANRDIKAYEEFTSEPNPV